ncbi:MAG TPA: hypothetical protein VNF99_11020 [Stellaceae bacterium]|nr:hypothetical protein [Stellaceae bacterium]
MTNKLTELLVRAETWPDEAQEELVRSAFDIEMRYLKAYQLTDEDRAALDRSLEDIRGDRFASETEVQEVFARFRQA